MAPHGGWVPCFFTCLALIPLRVFAPGASRPSHAKIPLPRRLVLSLTISSEESPMAQEEMGNTLLL